MNPNAILGVACVISFTLPVAAIVYNRYYTHRSLAALFAYYLLVFIDNFLNENYIQVPAKLNGAINLVDNYAYAPLLLTALLFFCPGKQLQKKLRLFTYCFLAYEALIISILGFTLNSVIYILGPGLIVIAVYSFYFFTHHAKFSIYHGKNPGKALVMASVFFDSASYVVIYFFAYILKTTMEDVFTLYYISSIVSSVAMAIGLHMMRTRMKELESLQTTRKELALFFGQ